MPQPYPQEFRDNVVLGRDKNTTIGQIAKDFDVDEATIAKWELQPYEDGRIARTKIEATSSEYSRV